MTDNAIALFKGANLPAHSIDVFKKALVATQQVAAVRGGTPFLRMLKQDGTWVYGANETEVQEGSQWAINPLSLQIGFVCWNPKGGKPLGKHMRSIFETPLMLSDMPDLGASWDENIGLELMCLNGEDKGTQVEYTANSYGGRKAFTALVAALQKQLDLDPSKIVPVVNLTNDSYKSPQWGTIFNPVFEIVSWMAMAAQAAEAPTAAAAKEEPAKAETAPAQKPKRAPATAPVTDVNSADVEDGGAAAQRIADAVAAAGRERVAEPAAETAAQPVQRRRRRAAAT